MVDVLVEARPCLKEQSLVIYLVLLMRESTYKGEIMHHSPIDGEKMVIEINLRCVSLVIKKLT